MRNLNIMIAAAGLWASSAAAQPVASGINAGGPPELSAKTVTGKPLSATEERRTVQILADGTRIQNVVTDKLFRDDEGRTLVRRADGSGMIHDPVQSAPDQIGANGNAVHTLPARYDGPLPTVATSHLPVSEEDLGYQSVNGVTAHGSRTTTTIPAGQIGNDRPLHIVSERWYSDDLQIYVKTVDSDPRAGETIYQLTDIHQGAPDPALFRHPTPAHPQK
jgi:hypothetical protein